MSQCPRCEREIEPLAAVIGPWHAGCAPKDVRDAYQAGYIAGMRRAAIFANECFNDGGIEGRSSWEEACSHIYGALREMVEVLRGG